MGNRRVVAAAALTLLAWAAHDCSVDVALAQDGPENAALPYRIDWPEGWQVNRMPLPKSSSGASLEGARITATRLVDGRPAAAILVVHVPLEPQEDADLEAFYTGMLKTLTKGFAEAGLRTSVSRSAGVLSGLPAIEARVTATGNGVIVEQWISITANERYTLAISFSGQKAEFEHYWDTFQDLIAGLEFI